MPLGVRHALRRTRQQQIRHQIGPQLVLGPHLAGSASAKWCSVLQVPCHVRQTAVNPVRHRGRQNRRQLRHPIGQGRHPDTSFGSGPLETESESFRPDLFRLPDREPPQPLRCRVLGVGDHVGLIPGAHAVIVQISGGIPDHPGMGESDPSLAECAQRLGKPHHEIRGLRHLPLNGPVAREGRRPDLGRHGALRQLCRPRIPGDVVETDRHAVVGREGRHQTGGEGEQHLAARLHLGDDAIRGDDGLGQRTERAPGIRHGHRGRGSERLSSESLGADFHDPILRQGSDIYFCIRPVFRPPAISPGAWPGPRVRRSSCRCPPGSRGRSAWLRPGSR
ncbi:hypothetical protein QFZ52_001188 [Arthrobacter woluwensis]|nr:hypothetical protein [Arthrobacter woluwensis]